MNAKIPSFTQTPPASVNLLLRGFILLGVIIFGGFVIHSNNLWSILLAGDRSKISLAIIALWCLMTARWVYLLYWLETKPPPSNADAEWLESDYAARLNPGWFAADVALKLGLLGTIIGFILMLSSISNIASFDAANLQTALKAMSGGMAVALYTTLAGLVCNLLLRLQFQMLANAMTKQLLIRKKTTK